MGAGILTGKYTAGSPMLPTDSRRAPANQARLTDRNLRIASEVDRVADALGCLEVELPAAQLTELDEVSRIELGFPYELLTGPQGQLVYGDLEPQIELPPAAPIRWR